MERLRKAVGDQSYKSDGKGCENVTRPYLFCDLRAWKFLSAGMDTRRIFRALRTVDAVARDLFASKRTPFNGNLFQRWKLIEANIVAYHSCDGTESVKHSTDLIWFNDLVSSVGAEKGIFHVLPSELFLKWTVRASGTLRQSSVKATIGQGGAYIEAGEYVGAWAVQRTKPWSFEHANMWRLFGDLKLGTSFPEKVCIPWILLTGGHLEGQWQHFMGGWCITATNGGAASFRARCKILQEALHDQYAS